MCVDVEAKSVILKYYCYGMFMTCLCVCSEDDEMYADKDREATDKYQQKGVGDEDALKGLYLWCATWI